jgi:hypothetical protein
MSACDFEELLRFKPESSRLVRDHIEHLKKSYHISNIDILIQAGVCLEDEKDRFGPKISKYIKDFDKHWRILGEEAHRKLVKYLLDNHFWGDEIDCRLVSSIPESLFVALRIFLEMGYMRTRNLQKRACGLYKTYRHSVTDPGQSGEAYKVLSQDRHHAVGYVCPSICTFVGE